MADPQEFITEGTPVEATPTVPEARMRRAEDHRVTESKSPNTTLEEDKRSGGQRFVNLVWEGTQAGIAIFVVATTSIAIFIGRVVEHNAIPFPAEWWTIVGLVIGFYFGRTNHARIGDAPSQEKGLDTR